MRGKTIASAFLLAMSGVALAQVATPADQKAGDGNASADATGSGNAASPSNGGDPDDDPSTANPADPNKS